MFKTFKPLPKAIFFIILINLISACGPATTITPASVTAMPVPTKTLSTPPPSVTFTGEIINAETAARLEQVTSFNLPDSFINTIAFSPDNHTLITGDRNGEVLMWNLDTWLRTIFLPAQSNTASDNAANIPFFGTLALSPDGNIIVTAYGDNGEVIGQDQNGQQLFSFSYGARVYGITISPDSKFLAVGGLKNNVLIFDLETRQTAVDLISDHEYISNIVFSPDAKTLVVCYERPENIIKTWDTSIWQETASFTHVSERIDYHDVLFSPDGLELVIASTEDIEIKFLDLATKQIISEFPEHNRASYQIVFSPDGDLLASAGDDGTVRLWNMETGINIKTIQTGREAGAVAFSSDGTLIAFSIWGEGVEVWAVTP